MASDTRAWPPLRVIGSTVVVSLLAVLAPRVAAARASVFGKTPGGGAADPGFVAKLSAPMLIAFRGPTRALTLSIYLGPMSADGLGEMGRAIAARAARNTMRAPAFLFVSSNIVFSSRWWGRANWMATASRLSRNVTIRSARFNTVAVPHEQSTATVLQKSTSPATMLTNSAGPDGRVTVRVLTSGNPELLTRN